MKRIGFTITELLVVICVLCVLLFLFCGGASFIVETPIRICCGWILFLSRNMAQLTISWPGVATFVVLFLATLGLTYALGRSFLGEVGKRFEFRAAFAVSLLIVALFAAGIGATGVAHQTGWLIRSPEPWLQSSSQAVYRMQDSNDQKRVGLGFRNFHSAHKQSDPFRLATTRDENGRLLHGWQTQLLPFVEEQALYESIDKTDAWNSPSNRQPLSTVVTIYTRHDGSPQSVVGEGGSYALSHLAANRLLYGDPSIKHLKDVTDGAANTILFGSAQGEFLPWGHPQNWRSSEFLPNQDERGFGSGFRGGCNIAMADGHVVFMTESIDPELWQALFTPRGGEDLEERLNQ